MPPGLVAHDLARGRDTPLRPRRVGETLEESLELPESASGPQLERALALLIDRLLARRERDGRTVRVAIMAARLVEGGTWRERVVFREPTADAGRMRLVLASRLATLPAPAETLRLAAERFGAGHTQGAALFEDGAEQRRGRLREAIRQSRAAAGPGAALRVLEVDPGSRVPERRARADPVPAMTTPAPPRRAPRRRRRRGRGRAPARVDGREIDAVRESWLVEDRWWTGAPVRRRYWEVVTTCGRNVVVFHELQGGRWFLQRG